MMVVLREPSVATGPRKHAGVVGSPATNLLAWSVQPRRIVTTPAGLAGGRRTVLLMSVAWLLGVMSALSPWWARMGQLLSRTCWHLGTYDSLALVAPGVSELDAYSVGVH